MNIDQLHSIRTVYFHQNCSDGMASALIIAYAFNLLNIRDVEFKSVQYGTAYFNNIIPKPGQLFVDITPPLDRWEDWKNYDPIVLDHHETAENTTRGLNGVYQNNEKHSGAVIAYEMILRDLLQQDKRKIWEDLSNLVMIRDTWKEKHKNWEVSQHLSHGLLFFDPKEMIKTALNRPEEEIVELIFQMKAIGKGLYEKIMRKAWSLGKSAFSSKVSVSGQDFILSFVNNTEKITSEVGNLLLNDGNDLAVLYFNIVDKGIFKTAVSLRSSGRINTLKISEKFGGGGHEKASGFSITNSENLSHTDLVKMVSEAVVEIISKNAEEATEPQQQKS